MKKRIFTTVMALAMSASVGMSFAACGGNNPDAGGSKSDSKTLQIYAADFGYGVDWVYKAAEEFPKQQWVKDKYGDINVPKPTTNDQRDYLQSRIQAPSANNFDVMVGVSAPNGYVYDKDSSGNPFYENLTSLLDVQIPGESVTIKQKMKKDILESEYVVNKAEIKNANPSKSLFGMPWVDGMMGLLYNETLIKNELKEAYTGNPKTTREMVEFSTQLVNSQSSKAKKDQIPVYIFSAQNGYWMEIVRVWWAQYEGLDSYHNFYKGLDDRGRMSEAIFKQKGKLYSMQALENLIGVDTGFTHENVASLDIDAAQLGFNQRLGFMSPNGDWVENETAELQTGNPYKDDVIKFMDIPVVSQIVEKMDLYADKGTAYNDLTEAKKNAYDDQLSQIIGLIDEGKSYEEAKAVVSTLTEKDYDKVYEARTTASRVEGHNIYIPGYSDAKDLAKDFLLFLASDTGINIFMTETNGCATPYVYDYENKLNATVSPMQQSKLAMTNGSRLFPATCFPLHYYGGLRQFVELGNVSVLEEAFCATLATDRKSAQQIYDDDIRTQTAAKFANIKTNSGY